MIKKAVFFFIFFIVTVLHFMVTSVVVLFLLSTLNILNRNIFHLTGIDMIEKTVTLLIFLVSAIVYFRSLDRISRVIKNMLFRDTL